MPTPNASLGTVFASVRTDAAIFFFLPVLIALFGFSASGLLPTPHPFFYPSLIVLFDMPHLLCGYWAMLTSRSENTKLRSTLVLVAIGIVVAFYLMLYFRHVDFLLVFVAHLSLWHFIKQQQTWFQLSSRPIEVKHPHLKWINKAGIYGMTWGFFLIGQCGTDVSGWDRINDLITLPMFLYRPLWILTGLSVFAYVLAHVVIYRRTREFAVSAHLIWLGAGIIWGLSRLLNDSYASPALIIIPHAVSYLVLLHKYVKVHGPQTWPVSPVKFLWAIYFSATLVQVYEYSELLEHRNLEQASWGLSLALALGTIHFIHDKIHWNSHDNPGWSKGVLKA